MKYTATAKELTEVEKERDEYIIQCNSAMNMLAMERQKMEDKLRPLAGQTDQMRRILNIKQNDQVAGAFTQISVS